MTRALVLGGPGFIGVAACKELMRRGVETIAASRTSHPYGTFTSHVVLDRRDGAALQEAQDRLQPDVVLDLAGGGPWAAGAKRTVLVTCAAAGTADVVLSLPRVIGGGDPTVHSSAFIENPELPPDGLLWVKDAGYACALACDLDKPLRGEYYVGWEGPSAQRARDELGWSPSPPEEALAEILAWRRVHGA